MAKQMVSDLKPGEPVQAVFLVTRAQLGVTKNGENYLRMTLQDKSGQIVANQWKVTDAFAKDIGPDDFIQIDGKCELYQNQLQINVFKIKRPEMENLRLRDFLPQSAQEPATMFRDLAEILGRIEDPALKALVETFLSDKDFAESFRLAPAAISNHHAYLGGLLEHTLSMARAALRLTEHYKSLRRDLLLTGVFLHDIGKTQELLYKRSFQYSDAGNLVGHIVISVLMLEEHARKLPDFPTETLNLLRHMILSHHGEYEFGSPKLPMFAEAIALHYIDNLDAKLNDFAKLIAEDRDGDSNWTEYSRQLERRLYKK